MKIHFLGGAGEYGRSSFFFEGGKEGNILIDFGVKRIEREGKIGEYPLISQDIARKLDFVLLSHAHDDHSSAIPLLYKMGYTGYIYATEETIHLAKNYIRNWAKNVEAKGGILPYEKKWITKIRFAPIKLGENKIKELNILTGKTGHMLGSVWFGFTLEGKKLFYSGDICFESILFSFDLPEEKYDIAIVDASYGKDNKTQKEYEDILWEKIRDVVERKGNILFPVPAKGRGVDLLLMLNERYEWLLEKNVKIYVEEVVLEGIKELIKNKKWLKKEGISLLEKFAPERFLVIRDIEKVMTSIQKDSPIIVIANDAMLSGGSSPYFFNGIKNKPENCIIFTGYQAPGTLGDKVLTPWGQRKFNVKSEVINIRIKAHLNFSELKQLLHRIDSREVFLVHCDKPICEETKEELNFKNSKIHCPNPGDIWSG